MIPRESLNKNRQSEVRTEHIATESGERARPGRSQRRPRRWFLRGTREQTNSVVLPRNVRREGAPNRSRGGCAPHELQQHPFYFWRRAHRSSNSALTCSHGMQRSGCFNASSARRSSSAICSGVSSGSYPFSWMLPQTRCASSMRSARLNFASISFFSVFQANTPSGMGGAFQSLKPSMNSSQRRCASSTRSSNGSFFAAEKNLDKDISLIYCVRSLAQGGIFARPIRNPQSAIRNSHDPSRNP